jgi:hypothetical protein
MARATLSRHRHHDRVPSLVRTTFANHSGSAGNFFATVAYDSGCERGIAIFSDSGTGPASIATETAVLEWMK